jgi:hypothetical protein
LRHKHVVWAQYHAQHRVYLGWALLQQLARGKPSQFGEQLPVGGVFRVVAQMGLRGVIGQYLKEQLQGLQLIGAEFVDV